jgi:flagellar motor switch protein FliG
MSDEKSLITELSGAERAAVLLLSIGEEAAAEVLKFMGPKEVQRIGIAMAGIKSVSSAQVKGIVEQFFEGVGTYTALGVNQEEYIRNSLVKALGEDKAGSLMDRILLGGAAQGLETLKWMDPRAIADMVRNEHPQIIAIVLAYLDSDQAAEVLSYLPERVRPDLLLRVATLDTVQPQALQELNDILEQQVSSSSGVKASAVGGVKTAAEILNFMDSSVEQDIMEHVKEADTDLSQQIEDLMFVFDDLADLPDPSVQSLLREVSSETLLIALKGTDQELREKFFKNMSKRAAEMLRDDLEAKGPVRLSEVEVAQKEILGIARRLSEEGTISLGGSGGEKYV